MSKVDTNVAKITHLEKNGSEKGAGGGGRFRECSSIRIRCRVTVPRQCTTALTIGIRVCAGGTRVPSFIYKTSSLTEFSVYVLYLMVLFLKKEISVSWKLFISESARTWDAFQVAAARVRVGRFGAR